MPKRHVFCNNHHINMGQTCKELECRNCQWLREANCRYCNDTGDMNGQGYLDCIHCNAATIIARYLAIKGE